MSVVENTVRGGFYLDSVALMRMSAQWSSLPGVDEAVAMIGTEPNKAILAAAGLLVDAGRAAGPADLILAVRAADRASAEGALEAASAALTARDRRAATQVDSAWRPRTLAGAHEALPEANLVLISTPGAFAAREARAALARGLNVMIFSDNVSVADEIDLKRRAERLGTLVMGPDCGTAYLAGVPLAFANQVARGRVGVVAASGTGLQEFACLLDRNGAGIAHGLGVGGRDLTDAVGGLSTLRAIEWLASDPCVDHIVLISKPPGAATAKRVLGRLADVRQPVTLCLLGATPGSVPAGAGMTVVETLKAAAEAVLGRPITVEGDGQAHESVAASAARLAAPLAASRWRVAGLYAGGTLAAEAQIVLGAAGLQTVSNAPAGAHSTAFDKDGADPAHTILDLGADEYTQGRPHPMLEPAVRAEPLAAAMADGDVAVVLLDVVLGYGAHADPAAAVVAALAAAPAARPVVIASVCGTEDDPQGRARQVAQLRGAGITVAASNADAAALAAAIAAGRQGAPPGAGP